MSKDQSQPEAEALLPLPEAMHEVERELQVRQRCFPRWVTDGKLTAFEANERLSRLQAALYWLKKHLDQPASVPA